MGYNQERAMIAPDAGTGVVHGAAGVQRLLIVDDCPVECATLNVLLRGKGFVVVTAATGRAGLTRLRAGLAPDLVLLDLMLAEGDGWDFLRERNGDPRLAAIPVIITTSLDIGADECLALGVACCRKPVHFPSLLREIRRLLTI
jgi:CheY-like chemotaxis protein